jgi:hypothetical protein
MHTVMIRGVILSYLLLSGLGAVAHAADQTIARTVENFTLGMPKDEAFAVWLSGIKQHHFTLGDTAQTPSPELMEHLEHTPMSPSTVHPRGRSIIKLMALNLSRATSGAMRRRC